MDTEIAVIGAGQSGLALGHELHRMKADFLILDAASQVGASWRDRWDSLRLFTPARYNGLPGLRFPGQPNHHPGKDEVAAYLAEYAHAFDLPLRLRTRVTALAKDDGFRLETSTGAVLAKQVVLATGPFQKPHVPLVAAGLADTVVSLHSSGYRNPEQLPDGCVVVVGAGNSGVQIAAELAAHGRGVVLSGRELPRLPQRFLGADLFRWFDRLGLLEVSADSPRGQKMRTREMIIGTDLRGPVRSGLITRVGRLSAADGRRMEFEGGSGVVADAVVWATGYRTSLPWVDTAVLDDTGVPRQNQGMTGLDGLYVLGLPWMTHRSSALLAGAGRDAALIAGHIAARRKP